MRDQGIESPDQLRSVPPRVRAESLLDALLRSSEDAILVVSAGRVETVNPAAELLLGTPRELLIGGPIPFDLVPLTVDQSTQPAMGSVIVGTADARRTVTYHITPVGGASEVILVLRDITEFEERERQLLAFTRTATRATYDNSLHVVLDRLAEEVRHAVGMAMCTVVTIDEETGRMIQAGKSGLPDDYGERLETCAANGAPLLTTHVQQTGDTLVVPGYRRTLLTDPRFSPLHDIVGPRDWDVFVAVPLRVRRHRIGALTGFLETDNVLSAPQLQFLEAMASQAAVAVENWALAGQIQAKAALEERHRLARELHDTVSQSLFSLNLHARSAQIAVANAGLEEDSAVRDLDAVVELAHNASSAMGQLLHHLRPESLLVEGLCAAIKTYVSAVSEREGVELEARLPTDSLRLEKQVELSVFRLIQEAVHNAVKHAAASTVTVAVMESPADPDTLIVTITDDGRGFNPSNVPLGRLGLATMKERAVGLGGCLVVHSPLSSDGGTQVQVRLPMVLNRSGLGRGLAGMVARDEG